MPWIRVSACWLVGSVRWLSRYVIPFVKFVHIQSFHSFSILDSVVVVFIRRRRRLYCCFFILRCTAIPSFSHSIPLRSSISVDTWVWFSVRLILMRMTTTTAATTAAAIATTTASTTTTNPYALNLYFVWWWCFLATCRIVGVWCADDLC